MIALTKDGSSLLLPVKVVPNASRDKVAGELDGALKVTVAAAPERGAANKAVCKLIARELGLRKQQVRVTSGESSPHKVIRLDGMKLAQIQAAWAEVDFTT
jgi:hypothetical protein